MFRWKVTACLKYICRMDRTARNCRTNLSVCTAKNSGQDRKYEVDEGSCGIEKEQFELLLLLLLRDVDRFL